MKIKHYFKELIYFIVLMTIFANAISLYKSRSLNRTPLTIKSFDLVDGTKYILKNDKPVLIHFWATWCPTCKLEASNIEFLSNYFEVITIAVNSGIDKELQQYQNSNNHTYKTVNDTTSELASKFNIVAFPTTFIYDKHGELSFADVGYSSLLSIYIKMLLAGI